MSLSGHVVSQFREPRGLLGPLAGWVMARRGSNRERNRWTLDILEAGPDQRILEIGFGPGYALGELLRRCPTCRVIGIDHSRTMVRQASRRNRRHLRSGRLTLMCGDASALADCDGVFDRVYSSNVVQFQEDRVGVFSMIRARLAPGGRVVTTYLPRHSGATDRDALRFGETLVGDMRRAGFQDPVLLEGPRVPILTVSVVGSAS